MSATPVLKEGEYNEKVAVEPTDVIKEGMIKKEIIINENIDKTIVEVSAKGERIIFQDKIKAIVCKETEYPEIEPKTAPAYIVSMIAELLNTKVDYKNHNENSFTLTARV